MVVLEKLIVVGMSKVLNCPLVKVGDTLILSLENNSKGIKDKALKVFTSDYKHVGYIRNTDLEVLEGNRASYLESLRKQTDAVYLVEVIRQNYIVIKSQNAAYGRTNSVKEAAENKITDWPEVSKTYKQEFDSLYDGTAAADVVARAKYNQETLNQVKGTNMINTNSMRDSFFREVKNVAIDIQTGKFGISNSDGISVYVDGTINVNPIQELGLKIPAFAMRIAVDKLVAGDIIVNGNDASFFVKSVEGGGYQVMSTSGEVSTIGNVKNLFFGANTVLAVKNMFEGSGMNPMMMAMMMGDGKMDMKTLMLMSMMGGQNGGEAMGGMNPMMLMLMMGDKFK